jgi:hypothetical protein
MFYTTISEEGEKEKKSSGVYSSPQLIHICTPVKKWVEVHG